jgi:uncharacterized membrane protein
VCCLCFVLLFVFVFFVFVFVLVFVFVFVFVFLFVPFVGLRSLPPLSAVAVAAPAASAAQLWQPVGRRFR